MAKKNPAPQANPAKAFENALKAYGAAVEARPPEKKPPLADPVSGVRDVEASQGYGQKIAYDWPELVFDPLKRLEYLDQMARAWMALWSGWLWPAGGVADPRPYDIFLSHAKRDEARIRQIQGAFAERGYRVYVDWTEDPLLDRGRVDRATAAKLQARMRQCKSLVLALSKESAGSSWVQWELGFFDALRGRVFILPLDDEAQQAVARQEYHELYNVLDPEDFRADFARQYAAALR